MDSELDAAENATNDAGAAASVTATNPADTVQSDPGYYGETVVTSTAETTAV